SPDNSYVSYIADNSVFITNLQTHVSERLTPRSADEDAPVGAAIWSNDGKIMAYNRLVRKEGKPYVQIFILKK
ncbi:MAG TPA: hypothetical protein VFV68_01275, partial [Agriterribacter sp.]|nr:hypothetical protein [Agriterribacter sp.]